MKGRAAPGILLTGGRVPLQPARSPNGSALVHVSLNGPNVIDTLKKAGSIPLNPSAPRRCSSVPCRMGPEVVSTSSITAVTLAFATAWPNGTNGAGGTAFTSPLKDKPELPVGESVRNA